MASARRATTCALALLMGALLAGGAVSLPLPLPLPPPPLPIVPLAQLDPKLLAAGGLVNLAAKCVRGCCAAALISWFLPDYLSACPIGATPIRHA
jgi:hypothetical protein